MIIIFRGTSGSFKTTLANFLADRAGLQIQGPSSGLGDYLGDLKSRIHRRATQYDGDRDAPRCRPTPIFSADDYHMVDGEYKFDPAKLSMAHGDCLRRFTKAVVDDDKGMKHQTFIVDNTNCSIAEVAPYAAMANAFVLDLHILTLVGDPFEAWQRNVHLVPMTNVMKQDLILRNSILEWPAWWPQQVFPC
jgi:hypothetical protein